MSNYLDDLIALMPPPASPIDVDEANRHQNEAVLGVNFPPDYLEFSRIYGSGTISVTSYSWAVFAAGRLKLPHFILGFLSTRGGARNGRSGVQLPFGQFPEPRGLLPFGCNDRDYLAWMVDGDSSTWKVVLNWSWDDGQYAIYEMGFVEVLGEGTDAPGGFAWI